MISFALSASQTSRQNGPNTDVGHCYPRYEMSITIIMQLCYLHFTITCVCVYVCLCEGVCVRAVWCVCAFLSLFCVL